MLSNNILHLMYDTFNVTSYSYHSQCNALYIKLMKRNIPVELLLENWLSSCFACVKWHCSWSFAFKVSSGVRQGSVLSPYLFAVYVDDVGKLFNVHFGTYIVLYADDILLLAPSVTVMHVTKSLTR